MLERERCQPLSFELDRAWRFRFRTLLLPPLWISALRRTAPRAPFLQKISFLLFFLFLLFSLPNNRFGEKCDDKRFF